MSRTEGNASLAIYAVFVFAANYVVLGVVAVGFIGALVNADFASDAFIFVSFHNKFWW